MATRAYTQVTAFGLSNPNPVAGPLQIRFFRVQGGTVGDTVTIPASECGGRLIVGAQHSGGADTTLSTSGDTQVVFTLTASSASTSVTCDAQLYVVQ